MSHTTYISVTPEAGKKFFQQQIQGPVVMLNLLKFRATADYTNLAELKSTKEISGEEAYQLYMESVFSS